MGKRNRGRAKPKPKDLIRDPNWTNALMPMIEQLVAIMKANESTFGTDRGIAITIGAHLERFLEEGIGVTLKNNDPKTLERLYSEHGPLGSFSKKIEMSFALGFIDTPTMADLNVIRGIRNVFAHATAPVTFDTNLLAKECKKLRAVKFFGAEEDKTLAEKITPRQTFIGFSVLLMLKLFLDLLVPVSQALLEKAKATGNLAEIAAAEKAAKQAAAFSQFFPIVQMLVKLAQKPPNKPVPGVQLHDLDKK